jgi:hypothetical protein
VSASERSTPARFFAEARKRFEDAVATHGPVIVRIYRIAGFEVRLRFLGDELLPIVCPAIEHLEAGATSRRAPDLDIVLWDADSLGVDLPTRPWAEDDYVARGDIRGFDDPVIRTAYTLGPNTLSMLDTQANEAVFCSTAARCIPTDYRGSPLLVILSWWAAQVGMQYVHAAGVGTCDGGVLIVGRGGSGKSTTALATLCAERSPLRYAADDYCLLDVRGEATRAHSIYSSAKIAAPHLGNFPALRPLVSNEQDIDRLKAVIFLAPTHSHRLIGEFPLKAILVPRVTHQRDTRIRPATALEGVKALAPSTLFQLAGAGRGNLATMASLTRQVPSYHLDAGTDLTQIPEAIAALLAEL